MDRQGDDREREKTKSLSKLNSLSRVSHQTSQECRWEEEEEDEEEEEEEEGLLLACTHSVKSHFLIKGL